MTRRRVTTIVFLGLVAAGALLVAQSYRRDLAQATALASTGSRFADTACGRIEYAEAGSGAVASSIPILVIHGAGGGFDQGLSFGRLLAAKGYRVIAPSRFGYLGTPLPVDASPAAQADAHACLLDALGIDRVAVVGVSAGAPSALQTALRHPRRTASLVLVVPLAYAPKEARSSASEIAPLTELLFSTALRFDFLFWAAIEIAPGLVTRAILATPPAVVAAASAGEQARVRAMMAQILPVSRRRQGLLNDAAIGNSLVRYELERISAPTLAVSARDDLYLTWDSARYTAAQIAGARFVGIESGGHVWVGHQEELISLIAAHVGQR